MSNNKFVVTYTIKGKDNILVEKNKSFKNEDEVIDFTKSLRLYVGKESVVVGKPTIICN